MQGKKITTEYLKKLRALNIPKYRKKYRLYIVEGFRNVADLLKFADVESIVVSEEYADKYENFNNGEAEFLIADKKSFSALTDTVNSQGIIAVGKIIPQKPSLDGNAIFLDNVSDPGNVGTILRTAAAAGYKDVYLHNCADVYSPKVVRSAMSAFAHLNLCIADTTSNTTLFANLKQNAYTIVCADVLGQNIYNIKKMPENKKCLVFGNEANGISGDILSQADITVSIPMQNIESLNVAVAAGIIMYFLS